MRPGNLHNSFIVPPGVTPGVSGATSWIVAQAASARLAKIEGMELTIEVRAGQEGKLFGSVSNHTIMEAINEKGGDIELREVRMPEGPIRTLGDSDILIHLMSDVETTVKVSVVPDADSDTEVVEKQPIGTFVEEDDY